MKNSKQISELLREFSLQFTGETAGLLDKSATRIESLEEALSLALQYVPLGGYDAENIYKLEKESYFEN